jgi:hypothetical protein
VADLDWLTHRLLMIKTHRKPSGDDETEDE